jgi:hypothetical protein
MEKKMNPLHHDIKKGIPIGVFCGAGWGLVALVVNRFTGVFPFESSLLHNALAFMVAGAFFGVLASAVVAVVGRLLPAWSPVVKAVVLTSAAWLVFRAIGLLLSNMDHHRYHINLAEALQGFLLSALMGLFIGLLWKKGAPRRA